MKTQPTIKPPTPAFLARLADSGIGKHAAAKRLADKGYTGPSGGRPYAATIERMLCRAYPDRQGWGPAKALAKPKARAEAKPKADPANVLVIISERDGVRTGLVRVCADPAQAVSLLCLTDDAGVVMPLGQVGAYVTERGVERVIRVTPTTAGEAS